MKNCPGKTIFLHLMVLLTSLANPGGVSAEETVHFDSGARRVTVIELYTSQGCSSCPPAEQWIGKFKDDSRLWQSVIPVAFHVDYWDYLGWHDTLADPAYSQRQRRYHREGNLRTVYTPAFVVNGKEWRSWFGLRQLPGSTAMPGRLVVTIERQLLQASFTPTSGNTLLQLNVAILGVDMTKTILAGENKGRILTQDFSVLTLHQQESDTGNWKLPLTMPPRHGSGRFALAVWVCHPDEQGPLQATGGWLPTPLPEN